MGARVTPMGPGDLTGAQLRKLAEDTAVIPQKDPSPLGQRPRARARNWSEALKKENAGSTVWMR